MRERAPSLKAHARSDAMDDALDATRAALLEWVAVAYVNQTGFAAGVAPLATRLGLATAACCSHRPQLDFGALGNVSGRMP